MSVTIKKVAYRGWPNCYRIANGTVELIVTADVGPRVIRFGRPGRPNLFKEYDQAVGKRGGKQWRLYGGHRLWAAPEANPRTYFPDNFPVTVEQAAGWVRLIPPAETANGLQKEIDIKLAPRGARVLVRHRLRNLGSWPVECAPWALSVMAPGGTCIVPLPVRTAHPPGLLPSGTLALWPYTDMRDPRWTWGRKYILLQQVPAPTSTPQKIGTLVPAGWAAYALHGQLFVKNFACVAGATYPDFGCNFEAYTNHEMLEVESLGPLTKIEPGQTVEHHETWSLFDKVPPPQSDRDVDRFILPKVRR